jgi:hypothetical protein
MHRFLAPSTRRGSRCSSILIKATVAFAFATILGNGNLDPLDGNDPGVGVSDGH